jgi:hypothetical protein
MYTFILYIVNFNGICNVMLFQETEALLSFGRIKAMNRIVNLSRVEKIYETNECYELENINVLVGINFALSITARSLTTSLRRIKTSQIWQLYRFLNSEIHVIPETSLLHRLNISL